MLNNEIIQLLTGACTKQSVFVLSDISHLGITNSDVLQLYSAIAMGMPRADIHSGVFCTIWLHMVRLICNEEKSGENHITYTSQNINDLLHLADDIIIFIGQYRFSKDGLIGKALTECLNLARSRDIANIEVIAHHFGCYGQ